MKIVGIFGFMLTAIQKRAGFTACRLTTCMDSC